jgi:hypothetical protein
MLVSGAARVQLRRYHWVKSCQHGAGRHWYRLPCFSTVGAPLREALRPLAIRCHGVGGVAHLEFTLAYRKSI